MKVAVVGATGLVGTKMMQVLEQRNFPVTELLPVASERSVGKEVSFKGKTYKVISMQQAIDEKPEVAIFSAGGGTSLEWAPKFAAAGITVIDNSSAWRMDPTKKLVVPEINASVLTSEDKILANPNCSTIQMAVALAPLHRVARLHRVVVSTYQAVSGWGAAAMKQLQQETVEAISGGEPQHDPAVFAHPIAFDCIPHIDKFLPNGYTKEELKMVNETRKILGEPNLLINPTTVRVPVFVGHSESVNAEFCGDMTAEKAMDILAKAEGVVLMDGPALDLDSRDVRKDPLERLYPVTRDLSKPEYRDQVLVGRIRNDTTCKNAINFWCVSDNLRKGAATNAVQIAEGMLKRGLL